MDLKYNTFLSKISSRNIIVKKDYSLQNTSWCGFGGKCKYYIKVNNKESLIFALDLLNDLKLPFSIIGETTNIFFLENVTYGIIINISEMNNYNIDKRNIFCEAGANLQFFMRKIYSSSISGYEGLEGIPGTLGGALFINAGAYGSTISDYLVEINVYDTINKKEIKISKDSCDYSHRSSVFKQNKHLVILSAIFSVNKGNLKTIQSSVEKFHTARHSYQEFTFPNLGSVFSSNKSIYDNYESIDKVYKIKSKFIFKIYYNRISRFFSRKNPNRKIINNLLINHFRITKSKIQIHSDKNINTFAFKGQDSQEILKFYLEIKQKLGKNIFFENIILDNNIVENNIENWTEIKKIILKLKE
jgi:UDP-N-acetylmuramate dehydrogenase